MDASNTPHLPLATRERTFIVLLALLQGLLLYLAARGSEAGWWPLSLLGGRVCWYTLVLIVPTVLLLSVQRLSDRLFWQHGLGLLVLFAALAAWAGWNASASIYIQSAEVLRPFAGTMAIAAFIITPYLQVRLQQRRWCAPYSALFQHAWQNGLVLILAAVFVGLGWSLLTLWGQLFKLIGIDFFAELFRQRPIIYLASGLLFGLGIMIGRTQSKPVQMTRAILFALFTGLLPMLSLVALLFLLSLPFTGLEPLWNRASGVWRSAGVATVLSMLVAHQILFLNAVYQDGHSRIPYRAGWRWLISASLLVMPLFALLALYALWLRVADYGWTVERFWSLLAIVVLLLYASGYALTTLRRRSPWLASLSKVNVAVSLVILVLIVLGNSPVLDPHRLAIASQLNRIQALPSSAIEDRDLAWLRFAAGRRGPQALRTLAEQAQADGDPALAERIERQLARQWRHPWQQRQNPGQQISDTTTFAAQLVVTSGNAADPALLAFLLDNEKHSLGCWLQGADCVLITVDAAADGKNEQLLCDLGQDHSIHCVLAAHDEQGWRWVSHLTWPASAALKDSFRAGDIQPQPPRWQDLRPADGPVRSINERQY